MKWLLVKGVIYVVFMVPSTPCQMVNVVCFHLLVWSEHGMKCLNIKKYIDIVFYGLFIKKKFEFHSPILPARVLKNELRHKKSHQT